MEWSAVNVILNVLSLAGQAVAVAWVICEVRGNRRAIQEARTLIALQQAIISKEAGEP